MKPVSKSRTVWTTTVLAPAVAWAGARFGLSPETQALLMLIVPAAVAAFRASDFAAFRRGAEGLDSAIAEMECVGISLRAAGRADEASALEAAVKRVRP